MRDFRFKIPIKLEDLGQSGGELDVYSVQIEYNSRELTHKLNDCGDDLRANGPKFIFEDFDVFYSCLKNYSAVEQKDREMSWKILFRSLCKLYDELNAVFTESQTLNAGQRNDYCNQLKMIVYLFSTLSELFEEQDIKHSATIDMDNIGKKGKKKEKRNDVSHDWRQSKEKGMETLLRVMSLPIHRLFNPPVVEDEFINVITKCSYKMLENPLLSRHKESQLAMNIFHIIGSSIEKHRQSLSFCLKLIQLLQHKEQLVSILAILVEAIVKKHNQRIIIGEIIREIKRIDIRELSRDSSGPKAISSFLVEVSERCSAEMIASISDLLDFLEEDSYLMRNATLSIIGILVTKELSKDGKKERNLRDQLLDKLEDHILDITSYTRSRALQVWCNLCQSEVIPLPRLETLIEAVVGRLKDKSCFVRRYAVQFLNQFLTKNPFAAKLPLQLLQTYYQKEDEKLKKMMQLNEELNQQLSRSIVVNESQLNAWLAIESDFVEFWRELESTSTSGDDDEDKALNATMVSDCGDVEEIFERFRALIVEKKFKSAISLMKTIKERWPDHEVFSSSDSEAEKDNEEDSDKEDITLIEEESRTPPLPETVALAKKIFLTDSIADETLLYDLGTKSVEKDIEKVATVLISDSQNCESNRPPTTTIELARLSTNEESIVNDISKQQILVKYLSDCVKFTEQIQIAMPLISQLLLSRYITDVQEAIEFFVSAHKFGVQDSINGIRKLILLIWSQEKSLKDAAISAYKRIYLESQNDDGLSDSSSKACAVTVVKSLTELVLGATLGELISIEGLLKELMNSGDIKKIHIEVMWQRFSMKLSNTTPDESRAAIQLIGMLATSEVELIRKNMDTIITIGLGERGGNDSRLVAETCVALGKAYRLPKVEKKESFFRLPKTNNLFTILSDLLLNGLTNLNDKYWNMMCDEAVKVIFRLAENPDWICEQLIRNMIKLMLNHSSTDDPKNNELDKNNGETNADKENISQSQKTDERIVSQTIRVSRFIDSEILSRFISLVGDVALNMLIHLDLNILTELKIRNQIKEEKNTKKDRNSRRFSKTPSRASQSMGGESNLEEEIGLAGANAVEDQEQEYLTNICNNEIILGNNLLAKLSEIVVTIARDPILYPDAKLRAAASLTLGKYMALSENFCRMNLQLLVTIMEKSAEPVIRANTVIAMGDLCVRFPNELDRWTPQMFQRLRDSDVNVIMNALKVLSRLILSDMVKVKGQISEIAILMVHENDLLSSLSRLFFTELGKKQNAIYNVMPDIISHLSDAERGLEEENFRIVMKILFDLIEKDRQRNTVCLVEKLCQRFRGTTDERQWRDLAYCLSLLTYNERSIQKLNENLICFADKLFCDNIYECITTVIANARKTPNIKTETKQLIDEFEQKVNECRNKGTNEDDSEFQRVVGTPPSAGKRQSRVSSTHKRSTTGKKTAAKQPNRPKRKVSMKKLSEESDSEEEEVVSNKKLATESARRSARSTRKLKPIIDESSDEDSHNEDSK